MMRCILSLVAVLGLCLIGSGPAFGDPILYACSATYLSTEFTPAGGTYELGVLSVDDDASIVLQYDTGQTSVDDSTFLMTTSLMTDDSIGGVASGVFAGGSLTIKDALDADMLTADLIELSLAEIVGIGQLLGGSGTFSVTGGSLADDFGILPGKIVQLTFYLDPVDLTDFTSSFTGRSNITLVPVPEPATLLLLSSGLTGLLAWRRKRDK